MLSLPVAHFMMAFVVNTVFFLFIQRFDYSMQPLSIIDDPYTGTRRAHRAPLVFTYPHIYRMI